MAHRLDLTFSSPSSTWSLALLALVTPAAGKHKMLSKLATQSFNILQLIARNPNFVQPKVPYFNVSRLSRLQMAQKWPRMTQNGPKWPRGPKLAQRVSRMAQNGPWDPFGQGAQNCSDGPEIMKIIISENF